MLTEKVKEAQDAAIANARTDRTRAVMALRRKHLYENQIKCIDAGLVKVFRSPFDKRKHSAQMEIQAVALEQASTATETFNCMRASATALKSMHNQMGMEDVTAAVEDVNESMQEAAAISQAMTTPLTMDLDTLPADDEKALAKELDELMRADTEAKVCSANPAFG